MVWILYLFSTCRYDCSFYMGEWKRFFYPFHLVMVVCCLINVFADYFIYIFFIISFVRLVSDGWVLSVDTLCQRRRKLYVQELIADCFCAGWWCDSACKYLFVHIGFLYTWWPKVLSVFLVIRTSRKRSFYFPLCLW